MNRDLRNVWRSRDVGEVCSRTPRKITKLDKAPDESAKAQHDVHSREAEHEYGNPEDDWRDLAGVPEAQDIHIAAEQANVDS